MKKIKAFRFDDLYESMPIIDPDEMVFFIGGFDGQCVVDTLVNNNPDDPFKPGGCGGPGEGGKKVTIGGKTMYANFLIPKNDTHPYFMSKPFTVTDFYDGYGDNKKLMYTYHFKNYTTDGRGYNMKISIPAEYDDVFTKYIWKR